MWNIYMKLQCMQLVANAYVLLPLHNGYFSNEILCCKSTVTPFPTRCVLDSFQMRYLLYKVLLKGPTPQIFQNQGS